MKILCGLAALCAVAVSGCGGLFHLNLAKTNNNPPPMIDYTGEEAPDGRKDELYYWFAEPNYGGPVDSKTTAQVEELHTTSSMYSSNDCVIFMSKDNSDLLQTTCYWQAKGVVRKANDNGQFYGWTTPVGSDSEMFTMDCELYDKAKAALDAKKPQPAQ